MTFALRFAAFAALTVVPFLRFLVENRFSMLRSESLAAAGLFCAPALLFAWAGRRVFTPLLVVCTVIVAAGTFQQQLASVIPLGTLSSAALLLILSAAAAWFLGDRFAWVLILFSLTFGASEYLRMPSSSVSAAARGVGRGHVLYLVLDGHIGLAGFPDAIPACHQARGSVTATLDRYAFTTYANASSNYGVTLLSIPSILNEKLLDTPDQFTHNHTAGGATVVGPNALFADFAARGYKITVYQHRSIDFAAGSPDVDRRIDYSSEIGGLDEVPGWSKRTLWLIGDYQGSARLLSAARAFLPFRVGFRRTGPLAVNAIWPGPLATDIEDSRDPTLFFVHLLIPHEPYVYRADGSVRPLSEWTPDTPVPALDPALYDARFAAYCQQVSAASRKLDDFLHRLAVRGVLDSMNVVIHGDHGSRIYRKGGGLGTQLRNEFSALLALRPPGARKPEIRRETASVMSLLARDFRGHALSMPNANSVFWVDEKGLPREIPVDQLWKE